MVLVNRLAALWVSHNPTLPSPGWVSHNPTLPSPGRLLAARRNLVLKRRKEDGVEHRTGNGTAQVAAQVEMEPEEEVQAEKEAEGTTKEKLRLEVRECWRRLAKARNDPLQRKRHNKVLGTDKALLARVEEAMMEEWRESESDDMWELNCLVSAGIEVVADRMSHTESTESEVR